MYVHSSSEREGELFEKDHDYGGGSTYVGYECQKVTLLETQTHMGVPM